MHFYQCVHYISITIVAMCFGSFTALFATLYVFEMHERGHCRSLPAAVADGIMLGHRKLTRLSRDASDKGENS